MPARITGESCPQCVAEGVVPARPVLAGDEMCVPHLRAAGRWAVTPDERAAWDRVGRWMEQSSAGSASLAACEAIWNASDDNEERRAA